MENGNGNSRRPLWIVIAVLVILGVCGSCMIVSYLGYDSGIPQKVFAGYKTVTFVDDDKSADQNLVQTGNEDLMTKAEWEESFSQMQEDLGANPESPLAEEPVVANTGGGYGIDNPYMEAYKATLEYSVPENLQVPAGILEGFQPVDSLVMTEFKFPETAYPFPGMVVDVPDAPSDVRDWECFPQDYGRSDLFNPGCSEKQASGQLPWTTPIAAYAAGNNWECETTDGWCADTISPFDWNVYTGYRVCHPAVGCVQDPDGGAAMIMIVNFHDSVEAWNVRNGSAIFVDDGFNGYGGMFSLNGDAYNTGEGIGHVRNHYFYRLGYGLGPDNELDGQCGSSELCKTATYLVVARVWDRPELGINYSHFELLDWGQWHRP